MIENSSWMEKIKLLKVIENKYHSIEVEVIWISMAQGQVIILFDIERL